MTPKEISQFIDTSMQVFEEHKDVLLKRIRERTGKDIDEAQLRLYFEASLIISDFTKDHFLNMLENLEENISDLEFLGGPNENSNSDNIIDLKSFNSLRKLAN